MTKLKAADVPTNDGQTRPTSFETFQHLYESKRKKKQTKKKESKKQTTLHFNSCKLVSFYSPIFFSQLFCYSDLFSPRRNTTIFLFFREEGKEEENGGGKFLGR